MRSWFLAGLLFAALVAPASAQPYRDERITAFDSDITINKDSSITVVEAITFNVENYNINHGIIRDFPTRYKDEHGDTIEVGLDVRSVKLDGHDEPFEVDSVSNGVEIKIGSASRTVSTGKHTYTIAYTTTFQLNYQPEGDGLYWNVTGNGWPFPIDSATATVHLPPGAKSQKLAVYTGTQGYDSHQGTIAETTPGTVVARTTSGLDQTQGLTIAVQWPKGFVDEPGGGAYLWRWLRGNLAALFGLIGLGSTFGFLYWGWRKWGKDPARGTIIPLFEPPDGIEPAEARYLEEMGTDNKIFAAAIVNMAVKGAVRVEEDPGWFSKTYTLRRTGQGAEKLSPIERGAYDQLFLSNDTIELKQANWQRIKAAKDRIEGSLQLKHVGTTFTENTGVIFAGFGILILAGLAIWATADGGFAPWIGGAAVAGGVGLVALFIQLMKAPTVAGQALRDRIDGFKMFLDTAEKERWEVLNPPEMTPQLFEKYLPFALALDVDHTWSETFEREMRLREPGGYTYQPMWYSGRNFSGIGAGALASSISNAMTSAISSSASPPGKSSGFGGGGFSGGGGGGGGGRGW